MKVQSNDIKIGLFVVIGVALLIGGLFAFGAARIFEPMIAEETCVPGNVDGLVVGAPVTLRGVPVGKVTRIDFSWNLYHVTEPRYIVIEFEVRNSVAMVRPSEAFSDLVQREVKIGLRARVKSQGLAGPVILSLEYVNPAEHPILKVPWKPQRIYIPSAEGQMSEIFLAVDKAARNVGQIDFAALSSSLQHDLAGGEKLIRHLDSIDYHGLDTNASALVTRLREVSANLEQYTRETNIAVKPTDLQKISEDLDGTLTEMKTAIGKINTEVGTLDVTSLNHALENLQRASEELTEALTYLKEYPSGALFGGPPPPARSVLPPPK